MYNKILAIFIFIFSTSLWAMDNNDESTAIYFESIKNNPQKLYDFLYKMPKGGDLHNHKGGSGYAENLIKMVYGEKFCLNRKTYEVSKSINCKSSDLLENARNNPQLYDAIIDAWSMRHFIPHKRFGHDHFFAAFAKFDAIYQDHDAEAVSEIINRAGKQQELYLELMSTIDGNASGRLGSKVGWNNDFNIMRDKLMTAGIENLIPAMQQSLDASENKINKILACGSDKAEPGCQVKVRYLYQVLREQPPENVFAQLYLGFMAANKEKRIVGINMVQPEDGQIAVRDYQLHMQMINYLHELYPQVKVSLHAGELNNYFVSMDALRSHINDAVFVAKAQRIGHGVDILQEDNYNALLQYMAENKILVEINLSSNDAILGVRGASHPLPVYLAFGVPVALSTDDEGILRSNLTKEFLRAVMTYNLSYPVTKNLVRNSLTYSFLPGKQLWLDHDYLFKVPACAQDSPAEGKANLSDLCQAYLDKNEKAAIQWQLEERFAKFEEKYVF